MIPTSEKQAAGFEKTSEVFPSMMRNGEWLAIVFQGGRPVFRARGCESQQHAEQIARDIMVRYALVERPTI